MYKKIRHIIFINLVLIFVILPLYGQEILVNSSTGTPNYQVNPDTFTDSGWDFNKNVVNAGLHLNLRNIVSGRFDMSFNVYELGSQLEILSIACLPLRDENNNYQYKLSSNWISTIVAYSPTILAYLLGRNYSNDVIDNKMFTIVQACFGMILAPQFLFNYKLIYPLKINDWVYFGLTTDMYGISQSIWYTETVLGYYHKFNKWKINVEIKKPWDNSFGINTDMLLGCGISYYCDDLIPRK